MNNMSQTTKYAIGGTLGAGIMYYLYKRMGNKNNNYKSYSR